MCNNFIRLILLSILTMPVTCSPRKQKALEDLQITDLVNKNILNELGVQVQTLPDRSYDPDLASFMNEFINDARIRGVYISDQQRAKVRQMVYVNQLSAGAGDGVIAACSRYYMNENTLGGTQRVQWEIIEVLRQDSLNFTMGSRVRLRELLYHELFHCLCNKGHLPTGIDGIMSPVFVKGDDRAFTDWIGLVNDMFSPRFMNMIPNVQ